MWYGVGGLSVDIGGFIVAVGSLSVYVGLGVGAGLSIGGCGVGVGVGIGLCVGDL